MKRCSWVNTRNDIYVKYHDNEWGRINHSDKYLYEILILEIFMSGLSWEIVLNKRENFREKLDHFNYDKIVLYDEDKLNSLCMDESLIRNRNKIDSLVPNTKVFIEIQKEFNSFNDYIWGFTDNKVIYETGLTMSTLSDTIYKDLKRRGMKYIGSTTIYSYLQAIGIVNSHDIDCYLYKEVKK